MEIDQRSYAVDLHDSSRVFDEQSLAQCEVYLKRGYVRADVPPRYRDKTFPFGLNYRCRTLRSLLNLLGLYGRHAVRPVCWKDYSLHPTPESFEMPPTEACDARVLFQTRLWAPDELPPTDTPEGINGFRVRMVGELKRAFGKRFVGGLMPTREASAYPDLVTSMPFRRRQYAAFSRTPAIGIYTLGLHGSNAFKVAEYLAGSKCIVGQGLAHEVPQPLGECHSVRETVEETVAECDALLSNPARLQSIRRASWHYYQSQVRYDKKIDALMGT